jgi:uncharacterized membrane protein
MQAAINTAVASPARSRVSSVLAWAIFALATAGVALSSVSLVNHYKTSATDYCDIGETFNCDIVNRSIYSTIGKVPVAAIGVAGYLLLMALCPFTRSRRAMLAMLLGALGGLGFALYLTYIEKYVLVVWCLLCLGSLAVISLISVLSAWQALRVWRNASTE